MQSDFFERLRMPPRATVEAANYDRNIALRFTPQRTI